MPTNSERITALEKWRTAHDAKHTANPLHPATHEHVDLASRISLTDSGLGAVEDAVDALAQRVDALEGEPEPPLPPPTLTGASIADYGGSFAQAIAAAPSKGNLVIVPEGTWPTGPIRPYAGLSIRGMGPQSVITRVGTPTTPDVGLIDVRASDVTISDLILRGTGVRGGAGDDELIFGMGCHRLRVQRVRCENAQGVGIQTTNAADMLFEDIGIFNTFIRGNGYHGVGLWPYHGTLRSTYRRITVDGTDNAGIFLDAGTTVGTAASTDDNVFEDIIVRNAGRLQSASAITLTGAKRNTFTRWTIEATKQALGFGADQSGLTASGNVLTSGRTVGVSVVAGFGGQTGNTVQGQGPGSFVGAIGNLVTWAA